MKTPLLDGIRKQAVFPRSLSALRSRIAWGVKGALSKKVREGRSIEAFIRRVGGMGLNPADDIVHSDIVRELVKSQNTLIAKGARPGWKLPKGVPLFRVSANPISGKIRPSLARPVDMIWSPELGEKARTYFTLGAPTQIFGKAKPHVSELSRRALRNRTIYIDPLDAVADISRHVGGGNVDWNNVRLSMMFTGRPVPVKPRMVMP